METNRRFQVAALLVAIMCTPVAGLLLRYKALSSPTLLQEPFPLELVGWLFITGLILGLTVHGIATYANLSQRSLRLLTGSFIALMLIYVGLWLGYQLAGQGLYGERLFAGLTMIYGGVGVLLLARFTKELALYKRPYSFYVTSLMFWGVGIWYVLRYFIR